MWGMTRLVRALVACAVLALLSGSGLALWVSRGPGLALAPEASADALGNYGSVPEFSLVERSGRHVSLGDLRGAVWVTSFVYTECADTCPLQSLHMSRLHEEFASVPDLRLVSITVDPGHDTADVLARYAERYRADPERWLFLTGSKDAIHALARMGFKLVGRDARPPVRPWTAPSILVPSPAFASHGAKEVIPHSSRFVLVDRQGRIRAYHRAEDPASLAKLRGNIRTLLGRS